MSQHENELSSIFDTIEDYTNGLTFSMSPEAVCWELTRKVIAHMALEDCVVYLYDERRRALIQVAAHGPKNPVDLAIMDPIVIKPGEGIVGSVFLSGKAEIISDTSRDSRYIIDDQMRLSEIAVPMLHGGQIIGVIDSEHSQANFYTERHAQILSMLASVASNKIVQSRAFALLDENMRSLQTQKEQLMHKNAELEAVNMQLDEIIYSITHDFRSPVMAAVGFVDMLVMRPDAVNNSLPMLKQSLHKVDHILQAIHLYHNNKRRESEITRVNLKEVVDFVIASIHHPMMSQTQFSIHVDSSLQVELDSFRLRIILRQAIMNALQFAFVSDEPCEMTIDINADQAQISLRIADNGPGFPDEILERHKLFIQRGSTVSTGLGIGISTMQEAAQRMRGELFLSNNERGGACVLLVIPRSL
ncbi:MAG: GAF domain-containing sensor histidine kinase [Flavobacteriales bacterium]